MSPSPTAKDVSRREDDSIDRDITARFEGTYTPTKQNTDEEVISNNKHERTHQNTPQKPLLKSIEKTRPDKTPELPIFKSQINRALNYGRTPARSSTINSTNDD